jgi:hypothetical protein
MSGETQVKPFVDANTLDKKIPQALLMQYQGKWYILKAGLEWKANYLFGGGKYGVTTEIIEKGVDYVLAKATFRVLNGVEFTNYGEASKVNVTNPQMHKYMLHLAITRAECRVLRMATACGYASVEEMDLGGKNEVLPPAETDGEPVTPQQKKVLKNLKIDEKPKTQGEAKVLIDESLKGK